jgi:putative hydrolase of the HAD superfamily
MTLPEESKNSQTGVPFPVVLFDWGDTIMKDDPAMTLPMALWPQVEAVTGVKETLLHLFPHRTIGLATGAEVSTEADIRTALQRVNLDGYFTHIFCYKNTGLHKPTQAFYSFILQTLGVRPEDVLMVGDAFEKDVLAANRVGIRAAWFNPRTSEVKAAEMYRTIHSLTELNNLLNIDW